MALDASGWVYLQATNTFSGDPASMVTGQVRPHGNLVAPAGTAFVRYQLEFR